MDPFLCAPVRYDILQYYYILGYLASRETGVPPHLTLESSIAPYVKRAVGLWPRG